MQKKQIKDYKTEEIVPELKPLIYIILVFLIIVCIISLIYVLF